MIEGRNRVDPEEAQETMENDGFSPVRLSWKQPKKVRPVSFELGPDRMGTAAHRVWLRRQNEKPPVRVGFPERNTVKFEDAHGRQYLGGPGTRASVSNAHARFISEQNTLERA